MKLIKSFSFLNILDISNIRRISYRNDINGLRAIAVLSVVFYHSDIKIFKGGWLGVDVFFVISGYLISNIIISELNENNFSFKKFYIRRVRRIIPALFSTILFSLPVSYLLLTPKAMLEFSKSISASILFYSNYYFQNLDFYNAEPSKFMPLLHTWSLAIEEQFYIVFPLFCFIIFKLSRKYFLIFLFSIFLFSIFLNSTTNDLVKFYQIQFRGWELLFGSIVMVVNNKFKIKNLNYLGVLIIFISFFYFDDSMLTLNSIEPRMMGVVGTGMILVSDRENVVYKILSSKYFYMVGVSSYSIYLFHQPLFAFYRTLKERNPDLNISIFILLPILITLSYLNWKYIEIYFQKNSIRRLSFFIFISLLISIIFIFSSEISNGFEERYDYVTDEVLFYSNTPNIYPSTYDNKNYLFKYKDCNYQFSTTSYCVWYKTKSENTIYLIGDSHTNALSVSFLTNLSYAENKYNLVFLRTTLGRCLLSKQSDTVGNVEYCSDDFFNEFLNTLNKEKDIVIAFGRFDTWLTEKGKNEIKCSECDHIDIFSNRLETISRNVSKFIIIEPIPSYSFLVADSFVYRRTNWGEPVTLDLKKWSEHIFDTNMFFKKLDLQDSEIISSQKIFCNLEGKNLCYASTENELYYSDSNHLTLSGANLITAKINDILYRDNN